MRQTLLAFGGFSIAATLIASSVEQPLGSGSEYFMHSGRCAECHSASSEATAMRTRTGDDVSPHGTWKATMMANSFRDPYWRAQVAKEVALHAERGGEIQALCIRCHAPMAHHEARFEDFDPETIASCIDDPLAEDGVSCTICHQIQPDKLGTPASFSGRFEIREGRRIFGPYENPQVPMMRGTSGYTPVHGPHIRSAALCGSCHTLITHHSADGSPFHEQTPYLEWRNSEFEDEAERTERSRTCQECHMVNVGTTRIARGPNGNEFFVALRDDVRAHGFVGGNAFMLDLMGRHHEELELDAEPEDFERTAHMTRRQLLEDTASLFVSEAAIEDGDLRFEVTVGNKTGHKLPTAYPARRMWLRVEVRQGERVLFESGAFDAEGRLQRVADELAIPHYNRIERPDQVAVFEVVNHDAEGRPTTSLVDMASRAKDNRLLPRGWRADGPFADVTKPVGIGDDENFVAGRDTVDYRVTIPEDARGVIDIRVSLHYQSVPPAWVDALRRVDSEATNRFVRMYDSMIKRPELLGLAGRRVFR